MTKRSYETAVEVRYRDTDSLGHISSPVYYNYLQDAYLSFMFWLLEQPKDAKIPQIMVKTACEYMRPAKFGDTLDIECSVVRFGGKSFDVEYLMYKRDAEKTLVAKGYSTHVMYDYVRQQTMAVTDDFKKRVLDFQGAL
jgi:acyl-CoA thioester hydrolase